MTDVAVPTRERILDAAFVLTTVEKPGGLSMRRLADRCELNVATLYHYFPSKADLLRAVLEERGYPHRLGTESPPEEVFGGVEVRQGLRRLLGWLWEQAEAEESAWRMLLVESLRGEAAASAEADRLLAMLEPVIEGWIGDVVPGIAPVTAARLSRLARAMLVTLALEHLALGKDDVRAALRIDDLVAAVELD